MNAINNHIAELTSLAKALDDARTYRAALQRELDAITLKAGQNCCHIVVAGRALSLTAIPPGRGDYMPKLVSGMEMVQLGLKKYYASLIEYADANIYAKEFALKQYVENFTNSISHGTSCN